jgi:hypothetical protein
VFLHTMSVPALTSVQPTVHTVSHSSSRPGDLKSSSCHPQYAHVVLRYASAAAVVLLQMTGIASTADYLDYWPTAGEYRKHSPG